MALSRGPDNKHKEALDAQALAHGNKVKELEAERDGLKARADQLAKEKDTANCALTVAQDDILAKVDQLTHANDSIKDLKLKLEGLEKTLTDAKTREGALTKSLAEERQLRKNDAANHADFVKGEDLWISRLADVAKRIAKQFADMGMPDVRFSPEPNVSPNAKLTLFFEGVLGALERFNSNWASSLASEARILCRGAMTKVLTKLAYWNPNLDFDAALDSLPEDADLTVLEERIEPIISRVDGVQRIEGQRRD